MDIEYYGPNGEIGGWYLGALRAAEEMAKAVGDAEFAHTCRNLFERGSAWVDANLFNGEYYEQQIRPMEADKIAAGLRIGSGSKDPANPDWQLGSACLVDQLVGQYMAHVCGLGHLLDPEHVRTALKSIMKYNFRRFDAHFNNLRTYALNDERALLVATYPRGERPKRPFPYFAEAWTGLEHTAAAGMIYEGQTADGLKVIAAVRKRYDGHKRSPWDEAECGHHYARAMAAWAAVPALTGFHYSGVTGTMTFAPKAGLHFWSTGNAWGTCRITCRGTGRTTRRGTARRALTAVELTVGGGTLMLKKLALTGLGDAALNAPKTLTAGKTLKLSFFDEGAI
jgi:uncharacterized protein (DUF608 family)